MDSLDAHGNPFSGDADAVELYDHAVDRLLRYDNDTLSLAGQLSAEHAEVPMTQALLAYLHLTSTDLPDVGPARRMWTAMGDLTMNDRERAHRDAIGSWATGDWTGAAQGLDALLRQWPADLLALQVGHQLDFFLGDAGNLRDRPGRTLPDLDPEHPHTALVRGMQAFGLEEAGHYGPAEETGLAALAVNPDDVWGVHAVVHTYEMEGRVDTGIMFMTARLEDWGGGQPLHRAQLVAPRDLPARSGRRRRRARRSTTRRCTTSSPTVSPSRCSTRARCSGACSSMARTPAIGSTTLADAWATRTTDTSWYVFNDLHAVMALVGAGRISDADDHVDRLDQWLNASPSGTNVAMTSEIGLPSCRAAVAFGKGRYGEVVDLLGPIRRVFQHFGGSHAQRDALVRTLSEAAIRDGQWDLARALDRRAPQPARHQRLRLDPEGADRPGV